MNADIMLAMRKARRHSHTAWKPRPPQPKGSSK
ncbi:hypothetical protein KIY76_gp86 [Mycobacterium phage Miramae]|uniref:Uncharacterized protein n=2 Tax=Viruses TaxID=10239 RepID=A0A482JIS7_9CAUD|nr:hypothetical protein KIY76_gp86 [Mycobacterium phage Miramae]QBP31476.1 hypothetical protein SEA_MIRAMAE_86 [Mycobacterium phage Miramae]QBP32473.1 hypothetical protein SEA_AVATARAHPEG_86 [Mycobacterium phage AvatarAhPeg]